MVETYNYQKEIQIDEYNLDQEWKRQPALVVKYGEALADAKREADMAKEQLDLTIAEVDTDIRANLGEGKKPTESALANMVTMHADVQSDKQAHIEAKHRVALLSAACSAFDNRRAALENLVKLHGMGYFAEPNADITARSTLDEATTKGAKHKVQAALQRRK